MQEATCHLVIVRLSPDRFRAYINVTSDVEIVKRLSSPGPLQWRSTTNSTEILTWEYENRLGKAETCHRRS